MENEVLCYICNTYVDKDKAILVGMDPSTDEELWMCESCASKEDEE